MATIETRLAALEVADDPGPLVLWVDAEPTPEQQRKIDDAERSGRVVIVALPRDFDL